MSSDQNSGRTGIVRVGMRCYMITAIQCLRHTDPLRKYIMNLDDIEDKPPIQADIDLVVCFGILLRQLWSDTYSTVLIDDLIDALIVYRTTLDDFIGRRDRVDFFIGEGQQDALEFFDFIIDLMHTVYKSTPENTPQEFAEVMGKGNAMLCEFGDIEDSIIYDYFGSFYKRYYLCSECGLTYLAGEAAQVKLELSPHDVKVPEGKILELENLLAEDIAWHDNGGRTIDTPCPDCGKKSFDMLRRITSKLPEVLVFQLHRFQVDQVIKHGIDSSTWEVTWKRDERYVRYPHNLDMSFPYSDDKQRPNYELFAVTVHEGATDNPNSGHYYAYAKHSDIESGWRKFDDHRVSDVSKLQDIQSKDAAVLFYRRLPQPPPPPTAGEPTTEMETQDGQ